jgi:hypothetical protein
MIRLGHLLIHSWQGENVSLPVLESRITLIDQWVKVQDQVIIDRSEEDLTDIFAVLARKGIL